MVCCVLGTMSIFHCRLHILKHNKFSLPRLYSPHSSAGQVIQYMHTQRCGDTWEAWEDVSLKVTHPHSNSAPDKWIKILMMVYLCMYMWGRYPKSQSV